MTSNGFGFGGRVAALSALAIVLSTARADAGPENGTQKPAGVQKQAGDHAGEEASNHFKRGLQLFDDGDYTLALVEFERAYQLAPNYRALYNIALVDMQLSRYADATRTLEKYLADGGDAITPARRAEVMKSLDELKLRTATVDISMNVPNAEVSLDGKPIDSTRLSGPMLIDAGEHSLRATAPGYSPRDRTVTLAGGDRVNVRFELPSLIAPRVTAEAVPPHEKRLFWPGFVATGAFAAGSVVSGVLMLNARSHLNSLKNSPTSDPNERDTFANRANTEALVADVFTGLTLVTGGISLYLSLGPDHSPKSPTVAISPKRFSFSMTF